MSAAGVRFWKEGRGRERKSETHTHGGLEEKEAAYNARRGSHNTNTNEMHVAAYILRDFKRSAGDVLTVGAAGASHAR